MKVGAHRPDPTLDVVFVHGLELGEEYRALAAGRGISAPAFYETQPLRRLAGGRLLWVVDAANADPGVTGCRPPPVPGADHVELCKPSRSPDVYDALRAWIRDLATAADRGAGRPWLHAEIRGVLADIGRANPALAPVTDPTPRTSTGCWVRRPAPSIATSGPGRRASCASSAQSTRSAKRSRTRP